MKTIAYIVILIIISACQNRNLVHDEGLIPYYVITSYCNNPQDPKNFLSAKYYDKSDRLLREIDFFGYCTQYIYDKKYKQIGKIEGRTCDEGYRDFYIFDSSGNHLGNYNTRENNLNLDTVHFEQIYFYDNKNRLIKEKVSERTDMNGDTIETWNYYTYDENTRTSIKIKENNRLVWDGTYKYDTCGRLIELKKICHKIYETDYYVYDDSGRIIEMGTKSNDKIISPVGTFDYHHNKTNYIYDSTGFACKEILYQDDKVRTIIINIKTFNKN